MNEISALLRRCLFLLLLTLIVASDGAAQGFESRIFFSSNRDGDWDIYSMDVNGTMSSNSPTTRHLITSPAASPDGRRIAFTSERGGTPDLYVMDSDGSNVIRLAHEGFSKFAPAWSPDGTRIAFTSLRDVVGNFEIYAMDADGNNLTRLDKHEFHDILPSWSPDGSKIAFVSYRDGGFKDPFHIFVMNADGTGRRNLTADTQLRKNSNPSWSPDGSKIAFSSYRHFVPARSRNDIFVITADGKELEQLTDGPGTSTLPVYSPDGAKIAYVSGRRGNYNIFLMDADGRNAVNLTRSPPGIDNKSPSWPRGGLAVNPNGKLPTSWGELKRNRNSW